MRQHFGEYFGHLVLQLMGFNIVILQLILMTLTFMVCTQQSY
jgi:hypothetical protein